MSSVNPTRRTDTAMPVIVISLPGERERREHARRQLEIAGVPFTFFDAIGGEAAAAGYFEKLDEEEFVLNCGRRVVPGEVGCFASHRALWVQSAETNTPVVILEDDFSLTPAFPQALRVASSLIGKLGFIRLQADLRARKVAVGHPDPFVVQRYTKPPHGLMGYCVSPAVARAFVDDTNVLDAPVDVYVKKYWEHGQPLYALTPYSVRSSSLCEATGIIGRKKHTKPLPVAARRFARRCRWLVRRLSANRVFRQREASAAKSAMVRAAGREDRRGPARGQQGDIVPRKS